MKKLFPEMLDSIGKGHIFCIFSYWIFAFVLIPFLLPVIAYGVWNDAKFLSWLECIYYIINALTMISIMRHHLEDAVLNVQINPKGFIGTVAIACGIMLFWALYCAARLKQIYDVPDPIADMFPISEMGVLMRPGWVAQYSPVFGTICLTVFVPFSVCGLFYAPGFAPVCCKKPWLAYLSVAGLLLLPALFDIFWREQIGYVSLSYILRLPVHLVACWTYQKTDSVWAPIASLAIFNLLTSLGCILLG